MTGTDTLEAAAAAHVEAFLGMLDAAFRGFGVADGLPPRLREAVRATPRHRFVHRFRVGDGPVQDFDADPGGLLPLVYRGQPLTAVDAAGAPLPSTNSEAAYVLWLVARLGIRPGEGVLEIGCGSGWLLGVMDHLAGPEGRAVGVEIIPALAAQGGADLAGLGRTVQVLAGDATREPVPGAPFERVMVTAATWDLPAAFFDLVAEGGHLLVPLRLAHDQGCDVTLLRRTADGFVAEWSFPGFFVPLVGTGQAAPTERLRLDALPFRGDFGEAPSLSHPLWFGGLDPDRPAPAVQAFRRYLALTEPDFAVFDPDPSAPGTLNRWASDFGILDAPAGAVAICRPGRLVAYGPPRAAARLAAAYRRWTDLGMPGRGAYRLDIRPAAASIDEPDALVERRGDSALIWRLDREAGAWRGLLAPEDGASGTV